MVGVSVKTTVRDADVLSQTLLAGVMVNPACAMERVSFSVLLIGLRLAVTVIVGEGLWPTMWVAATVCVNVKVIVFSRVHTA